MNTSDNKIQPTLYIFIFIEIKQNQGDFVKLHTDRQTREREKGGRLPRGQE
jgi:hypothetical protein